MLLGFGFAAKRAASIGGTSSSRVIIFGRKRILKCWALSMSSGRGAYYKNKYGGGGGGRGGGRGGRGGGGGRGRGRGGRFDDSNNNNNDQPPRPLSLGGSFTDLEALLQSIDGRSYPAYHDLEHEWHYHHPNNNGNNSTIAFSLHVGRAQSDPFAPPTRCQIRIPATQFVDAWPNHEVFAMMRHSESSSNAVARVAAADYLLRHLYQTCQSLGADQSLGGGGGGWSGPKGGDIQILAPTQHVLEQSAVQIIPADSATNAGSSSNNNSNAVVVLQLTINLPARGRNILGLAAREILCTILPRLVQNVCALLPNPLWHHVRSVQDQVWLQDQLATHNLVAFVPNGSILPRLSGVDNRPLSDAVPFQSPSTLKGSFTLPYTEQTIEGMGIPQGVTLICGGGFHGKSTLLQALQWGIHPKVPGDGREFCVVQPTATSIRAEDGRSVQSVNIADFLRDLPGKSKDTTCFSTENASGSTSQASNIVEAIELGAEALLMDEDLCATNAMIRDAKMIQLVAAGKEPITPFVHIVRSLYEQLKISTILVMGGTGDYFDVADHVLVMDSYHCEDGTDRAKEIVAQFGGSASSPVSSSEPLRLASANPRAIPHPEKMQPNGKVKVSRTGLISYGNTEIDLTAVEQIVSASQTSGISNALQRIGKANAPCSIRDVLRAIDAAIDQNGLDTLAPGQSHGGLTRPRMIEVGAAINRLRLDGAIVQVKK